MTQRDRAPRRHAMAATALVAAELVAAIVFPDGRNALLRGLGAACGIATLPLMFLPMFTLRRHGGVPAGAGYIRTTKLVERGPFALVRHPQYTGYLLLTVAFALLSQHPVTVALAAAAFMSILQWTMGEERELHARFGAAYEAYAARVPHFDVLTGLVRRATRRRRT